MKKQLLKMLWDLIEAGIRYGYPAFVIYQTFGIGLSTVTETKTSVKIGVGAIALAMLVYFFLRHWLKDRINEMPHATPFTSILRTVFAALYESVPYVVLFALGLFLNRAIPPAQIGDIEQVQAAYAAITAMMKNISKVLITSFVCFCISTVVDICIVRVLRESIEQDEFERRLSRAGGKK